MKIDILNSSIVQRLLRIGMSKAGPFVAGAASWIATHVIAWLGLKLFVPAEMVAQIQDSLYKGANEFGLALMAAAYAWVVHRQTQGVKILKAQLNLSDTATPQTLNNGVVGNVTIQSAALVTGVSVEDAAEEAGVTIKPA